MDGIRLEQWVCASYAVGGTDPWCFYAVAAVQGLGRLDCQLIAGDAHYAQLTADERTSVLVGLELGERITLSHLWVLGAYEFVRTLDQRTREDLGCPWATLNDRIRDMKHDFERLRIPLAKMEASRRNPNDSPIALPVLVPSLGIGWQIAADTVVTRRWLADGLLSLFSDLRAARG